MIASKQYVQAEEKHPLEPFLPSNARILMMGSFPPPMKRWCIHFYYPNFTNDMWRIYGYLFFGDKNHFVLPEEKKFNKSAIESFLREKGIAIYDTANVIRRLQDNASDKFLEVVQPTDVNALLAQLPECRALVTAGEKATSTLCSLYNIEAPKVGTFTSFTLQGKSMRLYRMPSSSRAYPMKLEKKADAYRTMLQETGILP